MQVQAALDHLGGVLEVLAQRFLRDVEHLDLHVLAEIGAIDQEFQAAPGRFDLLEGLVMHDCIELPADLLVQMGDVEVEQALVEPVHLL
ncbi:hypothetical protein D3C81_1207530 [compost metagenome]